MALSLLLLGALTASADVPSPTRQALLDRARVGDWAEYSSTSRIAGGDPSERALRIEAIAIEPRQVRLKSVDRMAAKGALSSTSFSELPKGKTWVELWRLGVRGSGPDIEVKGVVAGRETLTVGGARHVCDVLTIRFAARDRGLKYEGTARYWISPALPLQGIAKARITARLGERSIEVETRLTAHGRGR